MKDPGTETVAGGGAVQYHHYAKRSVSDTVPADVGFDRRETFDAAEHGEHQQRCAKFMDDIEAVML